mmetsp:Transcript_30336/g.93892  ORF Transcript_30336/g.93892 Transcript_30336/m.93892 type:complete len:85 (-) Transcript_30336:10-264(-)
MLHTIYKPSLRTVHNLFRLEQVENASRKGSAHDTCSFIMDQLLGDKSLDINVKKLKYHPRRRKSDREKRKIDTDSKARLRGKVR